MKHKTKQNLQGVGVMILTFVIVYCVLSWGRFAILHPKAGNGAFYVHFKEVVTWGEVPELQEGNE
jgi:hypothetical protein